MVKSRCAAVMLLVFVWCGAVSAWGADVSAQLTRSRIGIDESVQLRVNIAGDSDAEPDFSVLNKDFDIVGQAESSTVQIVNSKVSRAHNWTLTLIPHRLGSITVPPICAGSSCSQPVKLVVVDQAPAGGASAPVMLEEEVSSHSVLVGQQVVYSVRLLMRQALVNASLSELKPQGVETSVQRLGEDKRYTTTRNGWTYQVIERRYALFPQHSGTLHIPPLRFEGIVRNGMAIDPFLDPFGRSGQRIVRRTRPEDISVSAAPVDRDKQDWLPAQHVEISDSWRDQPPVLTVGEPATRTITITAAGLPAAQIADLPLVVPDGCKSYPDKTQRSDAVTEDGVVGTVVQKVALVPTSAGDITLPPLSLKWWDVGSNKWRTSKIPQLTLKVLPAQRQAAAASSAQTTAVTPPAPPSVVAPVTTPPGSGAEKKDVLPPSVAPDHTPAAGGGGSLWRWLALVGWLGWLVTALLCWRRIRRRVVTPPCAAVAVAMEKPTAPGGTVKDVIALARAGEASATRSALERWARREYPQAGQGVLERLLLDADAALRTEIAALDRHLYAGGAGAAAAWDGNALAAALESWQAARRNDRNGKEEELPDFYPLK